MSRSSKNTLVDPQID